MSGLVESSQKAVPAQLGFLAIYNPSLGATDETEADQIVYYMSSESQERKKRRSSRTSKAKTNSQQVRNEARLEVNEQLKRIGLAQGMVEFGKSFSDGQPVDVIETEKSRIILHELESGWWLLASIHLSILPKALKSLPEKGNSVEQDGSIEFSSREVKPAILLLGDLLRAHSTFLLHHASSLSALFVKTQRKKFVDLLGRYWDAFLPTWNVLLHGNPANSLYGGIKLAACGELGVGVGEEERGSGEREVLEGLVPRISGLVDVIVSKFGNTDTIHEGQMPGTPGEGRALSGPWLGSGNDPAAEDGVIYLGKSALSRKSLRDVSHWIEDLYRWGPYAYGVIENPSSIRPKRTTKHQHSHRESSPNSENTSGKFDESNPERQPKPRLQMPLWEEEDSSTKGPLSPMSNGSRGDTPSKTPALGVPNVAVDEGVSREEAPPKTPIPEVHIPPFVDHESSRDEAVHGILTSEAPLSQAEDNREPREVAPHDTSTTEAPSDDKSSLSKSEDKLSLEKQVQGRSRLQKRAPSTQRGSSNISNESESNTGTKLLQYFKFGYGTHWSLGGSGTQDTVTLNKADSLGGHGHDPVRASFSSYPVDDSGGHYLIGFLGNLGKDNELKANQGADFDTSLVASEDTNERISVRTVTVELEREEDARQEAEISVDLRTTDNERVSTNQASSERTSTSSTSFDNRDRTTTKKLRVVVYANKPFIFVFLFQSGQDALPFNSLYRLLHDQLSPIIKPLVQSTAYRASRPDVINGGNTNTATPIYDLVWDPKLLTVSSTIPNIPDPINLPLSSPDQPPWSRIEALNTHMQILNTYIAATKDRSEMERTCKTSRGWWVVWTRVPERLLPRSGPIQIPSPVVEDSTESSNIALLGVDGTNISQRSSIFAPSLASGPHHPFLAARTQHIEAVPKDKEIFLIRRASDYLNPKPRFLSGSSTSPEPWVGVPGKLVQGIGIDTKKYIEGLLNLNQ